MGNGTVVYQDAGAEGFLHIYNARRELITIVRVCDARSLVGAIESALEHHKGKSRSWEW